jgi:hypothetical protein
VTSVRIEDRGRAKQGERFVHASRGESSIQHAKCLTKEGALADRAFKFGA